jgi:transposase
VAHAPPERAARYARPFSNRNLPRGKDKREEEARSIGEDGFELLDAVHSPRSPDWLRRVPAVETLGRVWLQNYVRAGGEARWRHSSTEGLPPVSSRIDTPVDPESRTAIKSSGSVRWLGYKVHFTETCDDGYPGLITHVETTAAPAPDGRVLAPVHEALGDKGMLPSTHIADSGYMGIESLIAARRDHGVELLGPVRANKHWQMREGKGFDLSNFEVDWERERVTCPEGKHSITWSPTKDAGGRDIIDIQFSRADCGACPSLDSCVRYTPRAEQKNPKKQNPKRHLRVPARERYEALEAAASAKRVSGT